MELLEYVENQITPVETEKGKGRQMDPFVKCSFETARRRVSPSNILLWLCFPYFSLDRYQPRELPNGSLDHPARTLMQIYDSNQSKSRDLQQAVTKYDASNADKCLHVSQLWCLVINQSQLPHLQLIVPAKLIIYTRSHCHMRSVRHRAGSREISEFDSCSLSLP